MTKWNLLVLLAATALPIGCGGSGSSSGSSGPASILMTISDAPRNDVTAMLVDLTALTIKNSDGTQVNALPHPMTVDLAQLSLIPQVLLIEGVDSGFYVSASVTIDFTGASCWLVNHTTAATLLDDDGAALSGLVTLPIDLTAAKLHLESGGRHEVEFDFDLDQSLRVDLAANTVNVLPAVVVHPDRNDKHTIVAEGALVSVDLNTFTAVMDVETPAKQSLGQIVLGFGSSTVFQVDGVPSLVNVGLGQLAAKPAGTWMRTYVVKDRAAGTETLNYVEAGAGTPNGGTAFVDGYVIERVGTAGNDAQLTVRGKGTDAAHTTTLFNTDFVVDVGFATTNVDSFGSQNGFSANALNIGQHVQAYGTLTGTTLDASAASGIVRALPSPVLAIANGAVNGSPLSVDLVSPPFTGRVGPHTVDTTTSPFDWGHDNAVARDPNALSIDVGTLGSGLGIGSGTPVSMLTFFSSVDQTASDGTAVTLANLTNAPALLAVRDRASGMTVGTDASGTKVEFTLSGTPGADETASIDFGFLGEEALPTSPDPVIVANTVPLSYTLQNLASGKLQCFRVYTSFVAALGTALSGGTTLKDFVAVGTYDAANNSLAATTITAVVQ